MSFSSVDGGRYTFSPRDGVLDTTRVSLGEVQLEAVIEPLQGAIGRANGTGGGGMCIQTHMGSAADTASTTNRVAAAGDGDGECD